MHRGATSLILVAVRAIVVACLIAACGAPGPAAQSPKSGPRARARDDLPLRPPVDPIAALSPGDDDEVSWLVPGRIQLEAGGAAIDGPGGNRPIEVSVIDEQGGMVRAAVQLDHVRFSAWSDRARLLAVVRRDTKITLRAGPPSEMFVLLRSGAKVRRLAHQNQSTQVRYVGALSVEGWIPDDALRQSWPRRDLPSGSRVPTGRRSLMVIPGAVIRTDPQWTARELAVMASGHFLDLVKERDDGWAEVTYGDGELMVHGYVSKRDPPGHAHRYKDPEIPLAKITPNTKLASGTCLHTRVGGDAIGYLVGDQPVELADAGKLGWFTVSVDTPWGPIAFAARGPDATSLASCAPDGSVPPPTPAAAPASVP